MIFWQNTFGDVSEVFIYTHRDKFLIRMVRPNLTKSPKGLFDPYYVPDKLLHRDREMDTVNGVYKDSFEDEYGINCLVHGI